MNLRQELHYQYRCLRLGLGFLTRRFIHCNLQVTYRCNFKCQICDFWAFGAHTAVLVARNLGLSTDPADVQSSAPVSLAFVLSAAPGAVSGGGIGR